VGIVNLVLVAAAIGLVALGYSRARRPWARYQELKAQDQNVARYEAWRGGLRNDGPTGASIAMSLFRRQALTGAAIAAAGVVCALVGLVIRT
jgi:hypothetical protein